MVSEKKRWFFRSITYLNGFREPKKASLIRLLGSTKKKELRNQIIILLKQLFSNLNVKCDVSKEESNVFKFNQPEIRSCFAAHRNIFKADDFSSSNSQVREQDSDNESSVLQPAIEQVWLEVCHESCQVNRSELELILSIFDIIKCRLLSSKTHLWLKNRFFKKYPSNLKANSQKQNKINVELGQLFVISCLSRKKLDKSDWAVLEKIEANSIVVFEESNQLDNDVAKVLILSCCEIENLRLKFNTKTKSNSINFLIDSDESYILSDKINSTRRLLIEHLTTEISSIEAVSKFFMKNGTVLMEHLLHQYQDAMGSENITLSMGIEATIFKILIGLNQILRFNTNTEAMIGRLVALFENNLESFCLMSVKVQIAFSNLLNLLPETEIQKCINPNIQSILALWQAQIIEPRFMIRLTSFMLSCVGSKVDICRQILLRSVGNSKWNMIDECSILWLHRNVANYLQSNIENIDSILSSDESTLLNTGKDSANTTKKVLKPKFQNY